MKLDEKSLSKLGFSREHKHPYGGPTHVSKGFYDGKTNRFFNVTKVKGKWIAFVGPCGGSGRIRVELDNVNELKKLYKALFKIELKS